MGVKKLDPAIAKVALPWVISEYARHGYAWGPRAWSYAAEGAGLIDKSQFESFGQFLANARKTGQLDADIISDDQNRKTTTNDYVSSGTPAEFAQQALARAHALLNIYTPVGWWDDLPEYVELASEKGDVGVLFERVCARYHVPYTSTHGSADLNSRRRMLQRMRAHHEAGRKCRVIYLGDADPVGRSIGKNFWKNLDDCSAMSDVRWRPTPVVVDVVGLTPEQVDDLGLSWTDNLIGSSGKDMADRHHQNYVTYDVENYIAWAGGERKAELNAFAQNPEGAADLLTRIITRHIPSDWPELHEARQQNGRKAAKAAFLKLRK